MSDLDNDLSNNLYRITDYGNIFKDVTLTGTLSNDGFGFALGGDFTNNGIIRTGGGVNHVAIVVNDPTDQQVLLGGSGRLIMDHPDQSISGSYQNVLTQGPSHTIEGVGQIGNIAIDIVNQGTILANVFGEKINLNPVATFQNGGLIRAENGGIVAATRGTFTQTPGGRFEVADGTRFEIQSSILDGISLTVADLDHDISNNLYSLTDYNCAFKNVTLDGSLSGNGNNLILGGDLINNGIIQMGDASQGPAISLYDYDDGAVLLGGTGRLIMTDPAQSLSGDYQQVLTNGASHTIEGTGTIGNIRINIVNQGTIVANAATPLTFSQYQTFRNQGTIRVEPGSEISVVNFGFTNEGLINVETGGSIQIERGIGFSQSAGELRVNGTFQTGGVVTIGVTGGSVTGGGTIQSSNVDIAATVKPGNPIGKLTLGGHTNINGVVEIELQSDSVHDSIDFNFDGHGEIALALKVVGPASGFGGTPIEILSRIQTSNGSGYISISNVVYGGRLLTTDGRASFIVNGTEQSSEYTLTSPLFAPEFVAEPYAFSVDESASVGTMVGSVGAVDPEGSVVAYSISGTTPFAINPISGVITVNGLLDFSSQPVHVIQVGASDGAMTAYTPVTISINPLPGTNEAVVHGLLTGAGGAFEGQTDPAVVGVHADPDGDGISNVFELLLGSDPAAAGGPAVLVVFPLAAGPDSFAALDVTLVKSVDNVLVVDGQLTHGLQIFRNGARSQLSETATTRRLRFLDSVPIPAAKAFGRLSADPDAVK